MVGARDNAERVSVLFGSGPECVQEEAAVRKLLASTCAGTVLMCGSAAAAPAPVVDQSYTSRPLRAAP